MRDTAELDFVIAPTDMVLRTSADASHPDGYGHTGYVRSVGGATVFARFVKQKIVSKSSAEAELLALNLAADQTVYLRNLLDELGHAQDGPVGSSPPLRTPVL